MKGSNFIKAICGAAFFAAYVAACTPNTASDAAKTDNRGESEGGAEPTPPVKPYVPRPDVSAFDLDEQHLSVTSVTTGLKTYMDSETVVVTYNKPFLSDYVELLRCKADVSLNSNGQTISVTDVEISSMSDGERYNYYRTHDIFALGAKEIGCALISDGYAEDDHFLDTYAPSGDFRYYVRACVHPRRLTDKEQLTTRNCSRRFAVSKLVQDYTNARSEKEKKHQSQVVKYAAKVDQEANNIAYLAREANEEINACAEREQQRAIDQKVRNAWITLAASVVEIAIELKTAQVNRKPGQSKAKAYLKHYTSPGEWMDILQLVGASQGAMLSGPLILIASSSADMPRTCSKLVELSQKTQIAQSEMMTAIARHGYHIEMVQIANDNQKAADGEDVDFDPEQGLGETPAQEPTSEGTPE